jgi:hypothetical protein
MCNECQIDYFYLDVSNVPGLPEVGFPKKVGRSPNLTTYHLVPRSVIRKLGKIPIGESIGQAVADIILDDLNLSRIELVFRKEIYVKRSTRLGRIMVGYYCPKKRRIHLFRYGQQLGTFTHELAHVEASSKTENDIHDLSFEERWLKIIEIVDGLFELKLN